MGNTLAMSVIFFGICSIFNPDFKNIKKIEKKLFPFEIIAYE